MNLEEELIKTAIQEIKIQSWGATEQYMEIHDVVRIDGVPQVARVDMEMEDGIGIVYFPIKGEKFYLAIWFDTIPAVSIRSIDTENNNSVYLRVTSDSSNSNAITSMTTLKATKSWNIGDPKLFGKVFYKFSGAHYEPNPEPDSLEDKLAKLLDYLEQDKDGVIALANNANGYIAVDIDIHFGNGMIHGPYLSRSIVKRLSDLELAIQFYQYVSGNPFK